MRRHFPGATRPSMFVLPVVLVTLVALVGLWPTAAGADAVSDARKRVDAAKATAAAARSRATQLQAAANVVAGELTAVMVRVDRLTEEIESTQQRISEATAKETELRDQVRSQALAQYKRTGATSLFTELDARSAGADKLTRVVSDRDTRIAEEWRDTADDLGEQEKKLRQDQAALEVERGAVETKSRSITAQSTAAYAALAQAVAAEAAYTAELDKAVKAAEAAKRQAEVDRLNRERAASQVRTTSGSGGSGGGGSASIRCPIAGPVAFTNDWGQPRSGGRAHQGTDLFSARGTPNVAVVNGSVILQQSEGTGGLSVYLSGDDGNTYYYTHLNGWAGGLGRVSAGTTIGYTGNTGNASNAPPHTHFEIRRGGPNGAKVNPYPSLAAAC